MEVSQIMKLPEYGVVGVIFALIIVVCLLIGIIYKIVSNHINHNTESNLTLAKSLTQLSSCLENNTKSTDNLQQEVNFLRNQR